MAISKVILNNDVQIDITDTTASQSDVASTKYYYGADGVKKQGSYVVPSAVTQATPTISVNTSTGLITASATQSAGVVSAGTKSATEQLSTQAAQTLYPSTTDQTISSGKYLTGTQTVKGVLLTNLDAGNIKKDVVVKVGDSADDDRITSVTGTYEGSGGVTPAPEKDVNFIDYDGTVVYSYTKAEFANLSAMPANPTHTGLTAQGWNWSLSDAKTYVADYGKLWIGQMYVTSSGKTEIDIELNNPDLLSPYLKIAVDGTVTVDWGDGSTADTVTGTSDSTSIYTLHTYASAGHYTISIGVVSGSFAFYNPYILTDRESTDFSEACRYNASIKAVRIGNGMTLLGSYAFQNCFLLQYVTMPSNYISMLDYLFQYCYSLHSITLPANYASPLGGYWFDNCYSLQNVAICKNITNYISSYAFRYCRLLRSVAIPSGISTLYSNAFDGCYSLQSITIPSNITTIQSYAFRNCYSMYKIVFMPTTPPTVSNSNAWSYLPTDCTIYIPYSALASYISKSNYPSKTTYTYVGYATYSSGVTLPTQDSTQAYNVVWYATEADAKAQTNPITQGNGNEVYCRYTAA